MHGQYIRSIDRKLISEKDMFLWLSPGDLKPRTVSKIIAAKRSGIIYRIIMQ
jgi:5,10-methenyltetrahydromethanopterin hydrogenase